MLVLSRKTGERVIIAGNIRVVVLSMQGDRVKLGFEAPAHVPIHREEVLERIVQGAAVSDSVSNREDGGPHVRDRSNGASDVGPFPKHATGAVLLGRWNPEPQRD